MTKQKINRLYQGKMHRLLNIFHVFSIGYGDLGSSIYYALGVTTLFALGATPLALLLAGLTFVCTALTYAEISSITQEGGGSASFSRKAFNDLISFIAGWALLLDYIVTIAISGYSVGPYLAFFVPAIDGVIVKVSFASVLILLMILLNIRGTKHSSGLSVLLTFLSLITQILLVIIGFFALVHFKDFFSHLVIGKNDLWSPSWGDFWRGVAMAMVAYTGIESMAQLSGETKNPTRIIPRAMMITMVLLLFMYLTLSTVALSALTPQVLSSQYLENPIAGVVSALPFGQGFLAPWISVLAAVILIAAANTGLIGVSRLCFNMGEYFQLPKAFYSLHKRYKTPYFALIFFGFFAIGLIIFSRGKLTYLADLYNFGAMLAFFSAHLSLIFHRIRHPNVKRPFQIPFNITIAKKKIPITAVLGVCSTLLVWCLVVITKQEARYLGILWLGFGLLMYFLYRKKYQISPTAQVSIEKIKIQDYKELSIKTILLPTRGYVTTETLVTGCEFAKMLHATLTVVHVMEVPHMIPLEASKEKALTPILKKAQAISIEKKIRLNTEIIHSHSFVETVNELIKERSIDLLLLGVEQSGDISSFTEELLKTASCRVWLCKQHDQL